MQEPTIDPWLFLRHADHLCDELVFTVLCRWSRHWSFRKQNLAHRDGLYPIMDISQRAPANPSQFCPTALSDVLLLLGVHFFGITVNGSTRWLNVGFTRIQPSEIMKIALPMMVAWYFQKHEMHLRWHHYLVALALVIVPGALIFKTT